MANLTIGRVGLDVDIHPGGASEDGDVLRVTGQTPYGSTAVAKHVRQQLRGYADPASDERFVPVTCVDYPEWDGFYRVSDVSVQPVPEGAFAGVWEFSATLLRVRSFASPVQELTHIGTSRVAAGAWNLVPNPSGEVDTAGVSATPGTSGVAAITRVTATTEFGTRVLRCTWSTASTAAGGGMYEYGAALEGFMYSAGLNHVKSSIGNRLRATIRFLAADQFTEIASFHSAEVQVTAGVLYTASSFKVEGAVAPVGTRFYQVLVRSVAGTGYANWSIGSYLETDGWVLNYGTTMLGQGGLQYAAAGLLPFASLCVPGPSESLLLQNIQDRTLQYPVLSSSVITRRFNTTWEGFVARFQVAPDGHYSGAATLRAGDDLPVVVGRQVPNVPDAWVLGNELLEVRPVAGGVSLEFRGFIAGVWTAWSPFEIQATTDLINLYALTEPPIWVVLRNAPEAVTVRLMSTFTGGIISPLSTRSESPVTIDITLRRGANYANIEIESAQELDFHILMDSFTSAVAGPYHYRAADGRFLASPDPLKVDTDLSDISSGFGTRWSTAVGFTVDWTLIGITEPQHLASLWGGSEVQNTVLL